MEGDRITEQLALTESLNIHKKQCVTLTMTLLFLTLKPRVVLATTKSGGGGDERHRGLPCAATVLQTSQVAGVSLLRRGIYDGRRGRVKRVFPF
jgi:hypothetical protein